MKLSIVIVNYNVRYFLEQTLVSVFKSDVQFAFEVFVVDNNSKDESLKMLLQKFPQVNVIANTDNVGFSKANNQAIRIANGDYILMLNPDTILQEDTLQKCVDFMEIHKNIGGLGVKMYDGAGNFLPESKRGFPTPLAAFSKMSGLAKLFPQSKLFGRYHLSYLSKDKNHAVEVLSGAFMLLRKSVLDKIGLLDEDYFMYGEDIDLSYRIKKAGFENYYFADTSIIHFKGESTKKGSLNYIKTFYTAMLIFSNKHLKGTQGKALNFLLQLAIYLRALFAVLQKITTPFGMPVLDGLLMVFNLYMLQLFWENFVKISDHVIFPATFFYVNIPIYVTVWLLSLWFFGAYTQQTKWKHLVAGQLTGMLLIAVFYAFFPNYLRTSRGVIVFGTVLNLLLLSLYRIIGHIAYGTLSDYLKDEKKIIIIAQEKEADTIAQQLVKADKKSNYIGFVSIKNGIKSKKYLGTTENIFEIIEAYRPTEVLFSTDELTTQFIIDTMSKIKQPIVFRIVTKNNTIISSASKNTTGEIYSFDINLSAQKTWLDKFRSWI
ncbi:MAG TPA: glycosyltransferase [Chitinophagales bacterium]|nr:glycosyltransferase [Chitinophagales bacterium]HNM31841.1 glycosyltransferase [Chitinophagales bacterium]